VLVLVVDDFPDTVDVVTELLCEQGYSVALAFDGKDAVARALDANPDVIVMDLAMPRLDGLAATRLLKADPRTQNIPVVLYTAHPGIEIEAIARAAGCSCVVGKPAPPRELLAAVSDALAVGAPSAV
jgi:CheY-like chemotaxis protein